MTGERVTPGPEYTAARRGMVQAERWYGGDVSWGIDSDGKAWTWWARGPEGVREGSAESLIDARRRAFAASDEVGTKTDRNPA